MSQSQQFEVHCVKSTNTVQCNNIYRTSICNGTMKHTDTYCSQLWMDGTVCLSTDDDIMLHIIVAVFEICLFSVKQNMACVCCA